ncbi:hypothetical protein CPB84DRAFT_1790794 [Gymnopilus junonius]|uniref:Uncharacterized protein n=1 Tax=Gymnopilus junonius TaxID=109634 RepID=A0A9P5TJ48_GYMJU|nr:hypothetical protein CPB84DRAFT_1790794 [Gymnopilus junonius]
MITTFVFVSYPGLQLYQNEIMMGLLACIATRLDKRLSDTSPLSRPMDPTSFSGPITPLLIRIKPLGS